MEFTQFTIFHVCWLMGLIAGASVGLKFGLSWFGMPGAIVGTLLGMLVGHIVGLLPLDISHKLFFRWMARSSNEELRAFLAKGEWKFLHTMVLLQLGAREQDIRGELPRIVAMLESDSQLTRRFGWDALRIVYTEESRNIEDYNPRASTQDCRAQAAKLRSILEAGSH